MPGSEQSKQTPGQNHLQKINAWAPIQINMVYMNKGINLYMCVCMCTLTYVCMYISI